MLSEDGYALGITVDGIPLIELACRVEPDDARADGTPTEDAVLVLWC